MRGHEYLVALKPTGTGMQLETLHYESEIRKADPFFSEIGNKKADPELLEVATALIDKKTAPFDAGAFRDHYQQALRELIDRKLKSKGKKVAQPPEEESRAADGGKVIDLMSALKSSLEGGKPSRASGKAPTTRSPAKPRAKSAKSKARESRSAEKAPARRKAS
jgi:DNA end-binding protein Ku